MFTDVCRLCLGTKDLLWVFDEKISRNMTDIIHTTSGVEILKTDPVSQMVCGTCCQITIKMYKFRTTSIKNNLDLKAQCIDYNICQLTKKNGVITKNSEINTLRESNKENIPLENKESETEPKTTNSEVNTLPVNPESKESGTLKVPDRYENAHPSVKELVRQNPSLKIPKNYLTSDFGARIILPANEVEEWFKERSNEEQREPPPKKMKVSKKHNVEGVFGELAKRSRIFKEFRDTKSRDQASDNEKNTRPSIRRRKSRQQRILSSDDKHSSTNIRLPSPAQLTTIEEEVETPSITPSKAPEEGEASRLPPEVNDAAPPKPLEGGEAAKTTPEVYEEDELFTTRPLLRKPRDDEVLIISDSEDEQEVRESIVENTHSLVNDHSNMPNMSLLSVTGRTRVLYTCKVCDSQHIHRKDLKNHMKKTHTKCPFCSKRFKTLELRNEHVKVECGVNKNPVVLKEFELRLIRVDEDEEIRKHYPAAFDDPRDCDNNGDTAPDHDTNVDISDDDSNNNGDTTPDHNSEVDTSGKTFETSAPEKNSLRSWRKEKSKPQMKVVEGDVLKNLNLDSSDTELVITILFNEWRKKRTLDAAVTPHCSIEDGPTESEMKRFKNLCKPGNQRNIPIYMRCSPEVSVNWVPSEIRNHPKKPVLWDKMPCRDIKPVQSIPQYFKNPPVNYVNSLSYGTSVSNFQSTRGTNSPMDLSMKTYSASPAPLLLNGVQGSAYGNSIPDYNTFMQRVIAMARQRHSSVIKSTSSATQQLPLVDVRTVPQTIGNSFMAVKPTRTYFPPPIETRPKTAVEQSRFQTQPSIRVKNMNELC